MQKKVLLVDDEESLRLSLGFWLRRNNFHVTLCGAAADARAALEREVFDCVISDLRLTPFGEEGIGLMQAVKAANPQATCILVTATPADELPASLRAGALYTVYQKPVDIFELLKLLGLPGGAPLAGTGREPERDS